MAGARAQGLPAVAVAASGPSLLSHPPKALTKPCTPVAFLFVPPWGDGLGRQKHVCQYVGDVPVAPFVSHPAQSLVVVATVPPLLPHASHVHTMLPC